MANKVMQAFKNALQWLKNIGKNKTEDEGLTLAYQMIEQWKAIYANIPTWSTYQTNGLTGLKTVNRKLTAAAKVIAADLASLIWSEQPQFNEMSDGAKEVLENNNFFETMQGNIEYFNALGGIAVKGYFDGEIKLDFVTADRFVPLSYDKQDIRDAQFIDKRTYGGKKYIRVETYIKTDIGYTVSNFV